MDACWLVFNSCTFLQHVVVYTVETRSTDTHLIPTPVYNGQFQLFRRNAHIFSLKLTRLTLVICALYDWISYLRKPKRKTESCHITFSPSGWVAMNALWQSKLRSRIPLSYCKERILVWDWQMIASFLQNKLVTVTEKKWSDVFP